MVCYTNRCLECTNCFSHFCPPVTEHEIKKGTCYQLKIEDENKNTDKTELTLPTGWTRLAYVGIFAKDYRDVIYSAGCVTWGLIIIYLVDVRDTGKDDIGMIYKISFWRRHSVRVSIFSRKWKSHSQSISTREIPTILKYC